MRKKTKPQTRWCVVYRTGTPYDFVWQRTLPTPNWVQATLQSSAIGRTARVVDYDLSIQQGLPEDFSGEALSANV